MTDENLRPCPFCGGPGEERYGRVFCVKMPMCSGFYAWSKENWQGAFCWKEIDRLKAELAEKEKQFEAAREVAITYKHFSENYRHYPVEQRIRFKEEIDEEIAERLKRGGEQGNGGK